MVGAWNGPVGQEIAMTVTVAAGMPSTAATGERLWLAARPVVMAAFIGWAQRRRHHGSVGDTQDRTAGR